jgi:hypothetical protein
MKLLTKAIENDLSRVGHRSDRYEENPRIKAHFFNPSGGGNWYVIDGEKQADGDWHFFGLVDLQNGERKELGWFHLSELAEIKCPPFGLGIERDMYFGKKLLSDVYPENFPPPLGTWVRPE